jgi:RimJ/RimL family protein N-acetyltransferase
MEPSDIHSRDGVREEIHQRDGQPIPKAQQDGQPTQPRQRDGQRVVLETPQWSDPQQSEVDLSPSGNPVGKLITFSDALPLDRVHLSSETGACNLEPIASHHAPDLFKAICQEGDEPLWDYMLSHMHTNSSEFQKSYVRPREQTSTSAVYFAIMAYDRGQPNQHSLSDEKRTPMGMIALMAIENVHRSVEIGNVIYSKKLQKSTAATQAVYLLLNHCFEKRYRRVTWKCNNLNEASKRAALRLGFQYEGVSRAHMVVKGRNRDTAWFAMTEDDWEVAGGALRRWLEPTNFDTHGQQKRKLEDVRREVAKVLSLSAS